MNKNFQIRIGLFEYSNNFWYSNTTNGIRILFYIRIFEYSTTALALGIPECDEVSSSIFWCRGRRRRNTTRWAWKQWTRLVGKSEQRTEEWRWTWTWGHVPCHRVVSLSTRRWYWYQRHQLVTLGIYYSSIIAPVSSVFSLRNWLQVMQMIFEPLRISSRVTLESIVSLPIAVFIIRISFFFRDSLLIDCNIFKYM